jgi:predicted dithiol-disulfide oxidoreductase (DUF899 family)
VSLPQIASREQWLVARTELLSVEKELTRRRDALNAQRRRLPMVEIEKQYVFHGADGEASLNDLFDGARQLIVGHFMFDPSWDDGCSSCSAGAEEMSPGLLEHLRVRDTRLVLVSRAPIEKLLAYRTRRGWTLPWYSSGGSDFNYDFHVTLDKAVAPVEYNFGPAGDGVGDESVEMPGTSFFLRDGDRVFHTNSTYARGAEMTGGSYYWLDLTALGRQEDWEEPKGRADLARGAAPNFAG